MIWVWATLVFLFAAVLLLAWIVGCLLGRIEDLELKVYQR